MPHDVGLLNAKIDTQKCVALQPSIDKNTQSKYSGAKHRHRFIRFLGHFRVLVRRTSILLYH